MHQICDLYSAKPFNSEVLKFLGIFDKNFIHDPNLMYVGFLGVNIHRIKLVSFIVELKKTGAFHVHSVPITYRDQPNISQQQAFIVAQNDAKQNGFTAILPPDNQNIYTSPVYWRFAIISSKPSTEESVDGQILVDRLDGHIWDFLEYEIYLYDYNNTY